MRKYKVVMEITTDNMTEIMEYIDDLHKNFSIKKIEEIEESKTSTTIITNPTPIITKFVHEESNYDYEIGDKPPFKDNITF